jgi:membrane-associated protease
VKKLAIVKNKKAFTLLELTVSLFLLIILTLLLMLIIQTTMMTSKRFLDYSNYEYALAHKKILETYNNSAKVYQESNYILMKSKDDVEDVRINFRGGRIYIDKFKDSNNFAGYILVLKNMKSYSLSQENDIIHISIVDKSDHEREIFLKVKDEKTDKEKEKEKKEKEEKAKEEKENKNKDEEHDHNEHNKEGE